MASRYQIQMDFNKANQKAGELDEIANSLSTLAATNLENTLECLSKDWTGENAAVYIKKGSTLKDNMAKTAGDIRNTANTIRTVAKNIYTAEMEALRIAEERAAAARAAEEARKAAQKNHGGGGGGFR